MPTLWTRTLIPTLREAPSDAEVPSHRLMLRAALIRKLTSGVYTYLPLGWRSLAKAMQIVREEMDAIGAAEVLLPALQPVELWEKTGRRAAYGDNLFVLKDRHGRTSALGPTHEEVITSLVGENITSYRQLPLTLYQIQTKFRDEFRPRFGVLRSREFQMKDAYSFHLSVDGPGGLRETYQMMFDAYCRIFDRCGLPYRVVEAESGPIGGSGSHEFMVPSPTGEDTILESEKLNERGEPNYAANVETCDIGQRQAQPELDAAGALEAVHTPAAPTIEQVCTVLNAAPGQLLKTLVFEASLKSRETVEQEHTYEASNVPSPRAFVSERFYVLAVVRGDHDVNPSKLQRRIREQINPHIQTVELMEEHEALRQGFAVGFVGPHAALTQPLTRVVVDPDAMQAGDYITGANRKDYHVRHFNWHRDLIADLTTRGQTVVVADIRNALKGDPSPHNDGGVLRERKGIELGHIFQLGDKYTRALDVTVLNEANQNQPLIMGCYGIGINRILAAAVEREGGHDEAGIVWSPALAPYQVVITTIKHVGDVATTAEKIATDLEAHGVDVLIDDRSERPGVKFNDADLLGFPVRITIGEKGLAQGQIEVKARNGSNGPKGESIALDQAVARITALLA